MAIDIMANKILSHLIKNDQMPSKVEFRPCVDGVMLHVYRKSFDDTILNKLKIWYHKSGPQLKKSGLVQNPKTKKVSFLLN